MAYYQGFLARVPCSLLYILDFGPRAETGSIEGADSKISPSIVVSEHLVET